MSSARSGLAGRLSREQGTSRTTSDEIARTAKSCGSGARQAGAKPFAVMRGVQPDLSHRTSRAATGATVQRSPRRARHKPFQPLRREGRDVPAAPVCRRASVFLCRSRTGTAGASGLPVFPAPSLIGGFEVERHMHNSGETSRETDEPCLLAKQPPSSPAQAGDPVFHNRS
jgi:hypothetical protein